MIAVLEPSAPDSGAARSRTAIMNHAEDDPSISSPPDGPPMAMPTQSKGVRTVGLTCEFTAASSTITPGWVALNHGRLRQTVVLMPPVVVGGRAGPPAAPLIDSPSHPPHRPHLVASAARPGHTGPAMGLLIARAWRVTPTRMARIDRSRAARQPQEGTMLISLQRSRTHRYQQRRSDPAAHSRDDVIAKARSRRLHGADQAETAIPWSSVHRPEQGHHASPTADSICGGLWRAGRLRNMH
jgi:hypothetical protein